MFALHYLEFSNFLACHIITTCISLCAFPRVFIMDGHFTRTVVASCFALPALFSYERPPTSLNAFQLCHHCLPVVVGQSQPRLVTPETLELHTRPSPRLPTTCLLEMYTAWHGLTLLSRGNFFPSVGCIYSAACHRSRPDLYTIVRAS
jgi:hypothetical protein